MEYTRSLSGKFHAGRTLSPDAVRAWCACVAPFIQPSQNARIVDVGSGTGRFANLLARAFRAEVVGIEPSSNMLTVAAQQEHAPGVLYVAAAAERLPLRDGTFDVAWLSQVFHHLRDHRRCARELRRVLTRGGRVLLRGTFGDRLDGFPELFRFFPGARDICPQLPTTAQAIAAFAGGGFVCEAERRVRQMTCESLRELATRTRLRADTSLILLPDQEFARGQAAIEDAAHRQEPSPLFETLDLLVFRASP